VEGKGKNIVILGAGESGVGAAILAKKQGWNVLVSDGGKIKDSFKFELEANAITWEEGMHSMDLVLNADLIIKSPGIPDKVALIQSIKAKGIKITTNEYTIKDRLKSNNKFGLYNVKLDDNPVRIDNMIWFYLGLGTDTGLFEEIEQKYFEKYLQQ
jgi:UDP-N-acetylmuramate-alanine ligase